MASFNNFYVFFVFLLPYDIITKSELIRNNPNAMLRKFSNSIKISHISQMWLTHSGYPITNPLANTLPFSCSQLTTFSSFPSMHQVLHSVSPTFKSVCSITTPPSLHLCLTFLTFTVFWTSNPSVAFSLNLEGIADESAITSFCQYTNPANLRIEEGDMSNSKFKPLRNIGPSFLFPAFPISILHSEPVWKINFWRFESLRSALGRSLTIRGHGSSMSWNLNNGLFGQCVLGLTIVRWCMQILLRKHVKRECILISEVKTS